MLTLSIIYVSIVFEVFMEKIESIENAIKVTEERLRLANKRGIDCLKRSFGGACLFLFSILLGNHVFGFAQTDCDKNLIIGFTAFGALAGVWKTFKNAMSVSNYNHFIKQLERQLQNERERKRELQNKDFSISKDTVAFSNQSLEEINTQSMENKFSDQSLNIEEISDLEK